MGTYLACAFELSPWLKRGACAARLVMQNQLSETSEGGKSGALPGSKAQSVPPPKRFWFTFIFAV